MVHEKTSKNIPPLRKHKLSKKAQLEDNARGRLNRNSKSPSDCRGDGNTILLGVPKTTRQFNLTA